MRIIFLFFFLFTGIALNAQVSIKGIVLDSATRKPVPYSLVITDSHKFGVIANEKGEFDLDLPDSLMETLLKVTSIGFDTTIVRIAVFLKSSKKEILINHKVIILPEINISSIEQKLCKKEWGAKKKRSHGSVLWGYGWEMAILIPNISMDSGIISGVKFYIRDNGYPSTPFRAKLYSVNLKDNSPGKLLIEQDFILAAKKGNEWVEMDISSFNIPIPKEGFFVSMEWLPESKNHEFIYTTDSLGREIKYYGQVLGLTNEIKSKVTWYKDFLGNWMQQPIVFGEINAMIGADVLIKCK